MLSNVVLIGSGNVANVLGKKIKKAGHRVLQVAGRNEKEVQKLAGELGAGFCIGFDRIVRGADIYIVAVSDEALLQIDQWLPLKERLVVHTAGSVPAGVLKNAGAHYGTLYPFQSLRSDRTAIPEIPFLVSGDTDTTINSIESFARTLSHRVEKTDDDTRSKLHIGAVITNNFVNHLYTLAADFLNWEQIDFSLLQPLMRETVLRLEQYQPAAMQTGPAVRGDQATIEKHTGMLKEYPDILQVYEHLTQSIQNRHQKEFL